MSDDPRIQNFKDARANLRETAKWLTSGIAGVVVLIVGSTTISQLGSMPVTSFRLYLALGALTLAVALAWTPFYLAVDVLRSELLSLRKFIEAKTGLLLEARTHAADQLKGQVPGGTLTAFQHHYEQLRAQVVAGKEPAAADAKAELGALDLLHQFCAQVCITELVTLRFNRLMWSMKRYGAAVLALFFAFAWAANPPKDDTKLLAKPYAAPVLADARTTSVLQASGMAAACYGPKSRVIVVAGPTAGPQTAVFVPPPEGASACPLKRVTLVGGRLAAVE